MSVWMYVRVTPLYTTAYTHPVDICQCGKEIAFNMPKKVWNDMPNEEASL